MSRVLYLPGVGSRFDWLRKLALINWRILLGVRAQLIDMKWEDTSDSVDAKLQRIQSVVQASPNQKYIIVAESAGGSVGVQAFHAMPKSIEKLVTVCGKNRGSRSVTQKYRQRYPVLVESIQRAESVYPKLSESRKKQIFCMYSEGDKPLPQQDTVLPGSHKIMIGTSSHGKTIWRVLFTGAPQHMKKIIHTRKES